jgi:twitching motility protein PilT
MAPRLRAPPLDERSVTVAENIPAETKKAPRLEKYFKALTKMEASDLHLKSGKPPHVRKSSSLMPSPSEVLSSTDILGMAEELFNEDQAKLFHDLGSVDLAWEIEGGDRFRINVFRQRGRISLAARRVTRNIPDFEQLHLPPIMGQIAQAHQGLVLLSGPTGSGKSTTIASMLNYINRTRSCHIVTVEDPIEYLFEDDKSLINQREIGIDVDNFSDALKFLMRQDPDVVLIGEMRDPETFTAALQAAETGHLVFGTVHASSSSQTIGRIMDLFLPESRERARNSLALNLQAIVCQRLLPSIAEGVDRVPAVDVLLDSPSTRKLLLEKRDSELPELIKANESNGMKSFTESLYELIESEMIEPKVGIDAANNPDELRMRLKGIKTSQGGLIG